MFTLQVEDYKYIFEYDTKEELEEYLKITMATHEQVAGSRDRYLTAHKAIDREKEINKSSISFLGLEVKFVAYKRKMGKVGESTYKAYASTFSKLKEYYKQNYIKDLTIEDFEEFRDYLAEEYGIVNKTINNHMKYIKLFLDFAVNYKLIGENNVIGIESLKEDAVIKENFTDDDIKKILEYDYPENYKNIFILGAYTGMRVSEIINLTPDSIKKNKAGIYYFDIIKSKTKAGIRKVPIHKDILDDVLEMKFPLLADKSGNAAQKAILKQLYLVIEQESTKSFHTFRGTFVSKCQNRFPELKLPIKEIVGHSKGIDSLTTDTYGKGFDLSIKKEIVDSVKYNLE